MEVRVGMELRKEEIDEAEKGQDSQHTRAKKDRSRSKNRVKEGNSS